jgi:transposase
MRSLFACAPAAATRSRPWRQLANWPCLCWHLLTKDADYLWARPALVANKVRSLELQAGQPQKKGNRRGPAYAYNVKELREQEREIARRAEAVYEQAAAHWKPKPLKEVRGRLKPAGLG